MGPAFAEMTKRGVIPSPHVTPAGLGAAQGLGSQELTSSERRATKDHEIQIVQIMRAQLLIELGCEPVGLIDRPEQILGAPGPANAGGLAHESVAGTEAPRLWLDPKIGDDEHACAQIGVIAEMVMEIADRPSVLLRDQSGEGWIGTEAIPPEGLGIEAKIGLVAETAQIIGEGPGHPADILRILDPARSDSER